MLKTFKKSIALVVALVFVMSLVPFAAMAEAIEETGLTTDILQFQNVATSRSKSGSGWQALGYTYYIKMSALGDTSNDRRGYTQLDFSGYEEILGNESTTVSAVYKEGRNSTYPATNYYIMAYPGYLGDYDPTTVVFAEAKALGLHNDATGTLIYEKTSTSAATGVKKTIDIDKATLNSVLAQLPDSSVITLTFSKTGADQSLISLDPSIGETYSDIGVHISYDKNEIDNSAYITNVKNELIWDVLSSEDIKYVSKNITLPKKINGVTINWESSNEDVINPSSGEVTVSSAASANVTLTANLTYTNILEQTVTESKTFNVRVPKEMVALDGLNDGSTALGTSSVSTVESNGVGGKAENDSYIRLSNTTDSYASVSTANADGIDDVFEFSVLIPEESPGMSISIAIYGEAGNSASRATLPLVIQSDGIYTNYTSGKTKFHSFNGSEWNTITFVAPKGITGAVDSDGNSLDERNYKIYVNGVRVRNQAIQTTKQGLAFIRIGTTVSSSDEVTAYLDNIRVYSGDYNPEYDQKAAMSTTSDMMEGNKIVVDGVTTYEQVISSITTDEDTEIRVYDANGDLVEDQSAAAADGATVVLAARNGTTTERVYSYYKIYDVSGELVFDNATIDVANKNATTNINIFNYTGELKTYNVYWATYYEGALMSLIPDTVDAVSGQMTPVTKTIPVEEGYTVKFFVWESDGITPATVALDK